LAWILEQKFMTEKQVRQVFWKDIGQDNRETYRRLNKLKNEGFLTVNRKKIYQNAMYLVTVKGAQQLKELNKNHGLGALSNTDYANYRHDLTVTDIRIMFHELGFTQWLSERVLSRRNDLRRVPDGMILSGGNYLAIEYESSQKSKRRYREIFYNYELDREVSKVLYIVDQEELLKKVSREGSMCQKIYFVSMDEIKNDLMNARLKNDSGECSLKELLNLEIAPQAVLNQIN